MANPASDAKAAMARTLERLKARKKQASTSPSPLVKLSDKPSNEQVAPPVQDDDSGITIITEVPRSTPPVVQPDSTQSQIISYSFPTQDGRQATIQYPAIIAQAPALMKPKSVNMSFLFACHVVFNIPVTDRQTPVERDYVAYVFNFGIIFMNGVDVVEKLKPYFIMGRQFKCTFFHDDPARKSYNYVEVMSQQGHVSKYLKPQSAIVTLKTILSQGQFFVQESAFARVNQYYQNEFHGVKLVTFVKLLMKTKLADLNGQTLNVDANLLLQKVHETEADLSEVQVVPSELMKPEDQAIIDRNLYDPLSDNDLHQLRSCIHCNQTFYLVTEMVQHFTVNSKCGVHYNEFLNRHVIGNPVDCSVCSRKFNNALEYALHRDKHKLPGRPLACMFCSLVFWSGHSFYDHVCTKKLLSTTLVPVPRSQIRTGIDDLDPKASKIAKTCLWCKRTFAHIEGLIGHLNHEPSCKVELKRNLEIKNDDESLLDKMIFGSKGTYRGSKGTYRGFNLIRKKIKCSKCGIDFKDQLTYLIHMDHHILKNDQGILCKGCQCVYKRPCGFFKHACNIKQTDRICLICYMFSLVPVPNDPEPTNELSNPNDETFPTISIANVMSLESESRILEQFEEAMEVDGPETKTDIKGNVAFKNDIDFKSDDIKIDIKEEPLEAANDVKVDEKDYFSEYDQHRSLWKELGHKQEKNEWFVCLDCEPHKILKETDDSMDEHFNEFGDHYRINPAWWYSKFNLYIPDLSRKNKFKQIKKKRSVILKKPYI